MRTRVMAKATLVQAVAMVVNDVEVFWKRKKLRLSSSVAKPPLIVRLSSAAATSKIIYINPQKGMLGFRLRITTTYVLGTQFREGVGRAEKRCVAYP